MSTPIRNPFLKSPPPAVSPIGRSPELQARAERMVSIIEDASVQALARHGRKFRKLANSKKLRRQLDLIDGLPDELFAQFLDLLEAGMPDEYRHML